MAKTITVAGERLTEAQARILAQAYAQSQTWDLLSFPRKGESVAFARLAGRGLLRYETRLGRQTLYSITLHGKGVAAALAAMKEEVSDG